VRESDDLCDIIIGQPPAKGEVGTDVDMLMDIFKKVVKKDENVIDNQRANMSDEAAVRNKVRWSQKSRNLDRTR
jgi:hypothetical protein